MPMASPLRSALLASLCAAAVGCTQLPGQPETDPIAAEVQRRALASCAAQGATGRDCVPLVMCFTGSRNAFIGHSNPSQGGRLYATSGRGESCTGNWIATGRRTVGRLAFSCSHGRSGEFQFRGEQQVPGGGRTDHVTDGGTRFSVWSGSKVWDAFTDPERNDYGRTCVAQSFGL